METSSQLATQWTNPSDVATVLMVIGGDIVQKALAQSSGNAFTPVCFSFGWVAYAFMTIVNVIGEGRLLPPPDYPVKVINLESGHVRENRNWVIGRILRDHEISNSRRYPLLSDAIQITVYEAKWHLPYRHTEFRYGSLHVYGLAAMLLQLAVAAIPIILDEEWGIMLITAAGTGLALMMGALPQWKVEKLPNNHTSNKVIALASGNGAKEIMIIKGLGLCLDLEELATGDSPRHSKPWEKLISFSDAVRAGADEKIGMTRRRIGLRVVKYIAGMPTGFFITRIVCGVQSVLWLLLLINVAALKNNTWFLVVIGFIGMFQNVIVAGVDRNPADRNLNLRMLEVIRSKKVMDGLMDLHVSHECGSHLVDEFFSKSMSDTEEAWWRGERDAYDKLREQEPWRGRPKFTLHGVSPPREKLQLYDKSAISVTQLPQASRDIELTEFELP